MKKKEANKKKDWNLADLTDKERRVYEYICECALINGFCPSVREICRECHFSSTSTGQRAIDNLKKKGFIDKDKNKSRTIQITKLQGKAAREVYDTGFADGYARGFASATRNDGIGNKKHNSL